MDLKTRILEKVLTRQRDDEQYHVYRAALEWDLEDPIVIEDRDDLKSQGRWEDRVKPYHHQVTNLVTFCRRLPVTLLADDVGLGKTISAGLIMSELIARSRIEKILVVCPKLLGPQWKEELETKFNISAEVVVGRELRDANPGGVGAVITTYNSARMYLEDIPEDRYQFLVLDEAHKLRNLYGVDKPPQTAERFCKALEDRRFPYVLMLTATPIQNRLWDLYSLVHLLSVSRGHQNPFGSPGQFARKFIADKRENARKLKTEAQEEFRSVIFGYMSRVRRGDAKLYFPDRKVQLHEVDPSPGEIELIEAIAGPIQFLNPLVQISILQALVSSPEALSAQLTNMAAKGSIDREVSINVKSIVARMELTSKLLGLGALIERLKSQDPNRWRLVVFTTRLETQTTIEDFLSKRELKVGVINGSTASRNQDTLTRFRADPPELNVIVSTEAGSEGVNLQVANVLVNYDLPWNPMIVEQRIGRVQRLGTEHASVAIFNIVLRGTFEEYIVGRLMEKLQLASHAIGDIESLLEATGVSEDGDSEETSLEDKIRQLVLEALTRKDVQQAVQMAEESIENAETQLERERENIDSMLGNMEGSEHVGPRAPSLPPNEHSMSARDFILTAYRHVGAVVREVGDGTWSLQADGTKQRITFDKAAGSDPKLIYYAPGTAAFSRLVSRITSSGVHDVLDENNNPEQRIEELTRSWTAKFGGVVEAIKTIGVEREFNGRALLKVRATVAHDQYERLVEISCEPGQHMVLADKAGLQPVPIVIEDPRAVGIDTERLPSLVQNDPGVAEFCRFYLERRNDELEAAGSDESKQHKLRTDFTPQLEIEIAGLEGKMSRNSHALVNYSIDGHGGYQSKLVVRLKDGFFLSGPRTETCAISGLRVPVECIAECALSGAHALQHLLVESEESGRHALPKFVAKCALSGATLFQDELEVSAMSGLLVSKSLMQTSGISNRRAEQEYLAKCEFTGVDAINDELSVSEFSGKRYRSDEQVQSFVSGKYGHQQEFIGCHETRQPLALVEAEACEVTGKQVRPGVLQRCEITGANVLPCELERCAFSNKSALRRLLVTSSVSMSRILKDLSIQSDGGNFCTSTEAATCSWSGELTHPDDFKSCELTGLSFHRKYLSSKMWLLPLQQILDSASHKVDKQQAWPQIAINISKKLRINRARIEAACLSPNGALLALLVEGRMYLGLRTLHIGGLYSLNDNTIVGRTTKGKQAPQGWVET